MRKIEFRGLIKETREWIYGDLIHDIKTGRMAISTQKNLTEVIPKTIGQFTGLYDSKRTEEYPNGQPIYEGDIIKSNKSKYKKFNEGGIYEVYFNEFLCHYALIDSSHKWNHKNEQYDNYSLTGAKTKDFEVIGNIHQKGDILE